MLENDTGRMVALIIRETGWPLEYVLNMPVVTASRLVQHLSYLTAVDNYERASNFAMIMANYFTAHSKNRRYRTSDFIGEPPREDKCLTQGGDFVMMTELTNVTRTLTDGKEYTFSPMNIKMMAEVEAKFDMPYPKCLIETRMTYLWFIFYVMLKKNHPKITEDEVGELIDGKKIIAIRKELAGLIGGG